MFSDLVEFSDEEGYGKYLDLHELYDKYLNLKGIEVSITSESCHIIFLSIKQQTTVFLTEKITTFRPYILGNP